MATKKENIEFGDIIKIKTPSEVLEGKLLESQDSEFHLIKLKSGYNIGVRKENIIDLDLLKKAEKEKKSKIKIVENPKLKNIDIIMTGGTISSRLDIKTGAVNWLTSPEDFFKFYPELFDIVNVNNVEIPFMMASESMDYRHWKKIAQIVEKSLNDENVSGVVITHGTDFLHLTAAALSFFFPNPNKPIVLTYSQRSSDRASSDANLNLKSAAKAAVSDIAEVVLVGHGSSNDDFCLALRGSKVRKMHSSKREAFNPINLDPIAKIWPNKIEKISPYRERNDLRKIKGDIVFNDKIALIKYYPGQDPDILDYYFNKKYEGLIIEGGALGHVATNETDKSWTPK